MTEASGLPSGSANTAQQTARQVRQESEVLYRAASVFPFDLFPVEIVIDKNKVTISNQVFFGSHEVKTIAIADIFSVEIDTSPFFSTLKVFHRMPMIPELIIPYLRKKDAVQMQKILQGLLIAKNEKIDVAPLSASQALSQVSRLGDTRTATS